MVASVRNDDSIQSLNGLSDQMIIQNHAWRRDKSVCKKGIVGSSGYFQLLGIGGPVPGEG